MTDKDRLKDLIDNAKKPSVNEWVYNVEAFLGDTKSSTKEASTLIENIKFQGDEFQYCANLIAWLRQLYKRKYDNVEIHPLQSEIKYSLL